MTLIKIQEEIKEKSELMYKTAKLIKDEKTKSNLLSGAFAYEDCSDMLIKFVMSSNEKDNK